MAAPGRGGAQWLSQSCEGLGLEKMNNEVDIGVRVEVPNAVMDHLTRHLYEAKLVYYSDTFESKVRTFCMNPGGVVCGEYYEGRPGGGQRPQLWRGGAAAPATPTLPCWCPPGLPSRSTSPSPMGSISPRLGEHADRGAASWLQRLERPAAWAGGPPGAGWRNRPTVPTLATAVPGDLSFVAAAAAFDQSILEALARPSTTWRPGSKRQEHPSVRRGGEVLLQQGRR